MKENIISKLSPGKSGPEDLRPISAEKPVPDPKIGSRYFLPTSGGETYPCHVLGTSPRGILIKAGEDILIIERQSFQDFAIPFPPIKIESILPDGDSRIIFVRYSFNTSLVDKVYNWYVSKFKKKVDVDI